MKKILFSLVALACCMSMNAQIMKIMKNGVVVKTYTTAEADEVVFEEAPFGTGTATRTGDIEVNWVQLWAYGPKFAEYNVGAAHNKAQDYGGYYCWGGSIDKDPNTAHKSGDTPLIDAEDTATNLWGDNWRMPTMAELDGLIANCDVTWTNNYKESGIKGRIFTGRGDYAANSLFLPAAGRRDLGEVVDEGIHGSYWTSTPYNSDYSYFLIFGAGSKDVGYDLRYYSYSVRPVLAEQ